MNLATSEVYTSTYTVLQSVHYRSEGRVYDFPHCMYSMRQKNSSNPCMDVRFLKMVKERILNRNRTGSKRFLTGLQMAGTRSVPSSYIPFRPYATLFFKAAKDRKVSVDL